MYRRLAVSLLAAACSACGTPVRPPSAPPAAEFLVATRDSTFWVTTHAGGARVRGVPMTLARFGGHFYEVYVADDDASYEDALLVGQRVWRRDLVSGDSSVVFADTVVPRVARSYALAHPDAEPLDPDEDVGDDPGTVATADVRVLAVYGPYLSYEYHVDVELPSPSRRPMHAARRGVVDLRTGRAQRLSDLFADTVAVRVARLGEEAYRSAVGSSLARFGGREPQARRAQRAVARHRFDASSFILSSLDGVPVVSFGAPGAGGDDSLLPLPPIAAGDAPWWRETADALPLGEGDGTLDRWRHGRYDVLARYDSLGESARLSLAARTASGATGREDEWPLATVRPPVLQIFWLDRPSVGIDDRRALARAFDEASLYDDNARTASLEGRAPRVEGRRLRLARRSVRPPTLDPRSSSRS